MSVKKEYFGKLSDGQDVNCYIINNNDMSVVLSEFGATVTSIKYKNNNNPIELILGFDDLSGFEKDSKETKTYMGTSVGRFANRIAKCSFSLNGKEYKLEQNDGQNCLHSGFDGYSKRVWKSNAIDDNSVCFELESPDMDQGFPGRANIKATYVLKNDNTLSICYECKADSDTLVNLTNHTYFNLSGKGDILSHELQLNADSYIAVDNNLIPVPGEAKSVKGTAFDFTSSKKIGTDIEKANGYDHCFVIDRNNEKKMRLCAIAKALDTGMIMQMYTDMPGVQFYSGNFLNLDGRNSVHYGKHTGFCLEAEYFPDSPNRKDFPSCLLKAGDTYKHYIDYKFSRA